MILLTCNVLSGNWLVRSQEMWVVMGIVCVKSSLIGCLIGGEPMSEWL